MQVISVDVVQMYYVGGESLGFGNEPSGGRARVQPVAVAESCGGPVHAGGECIGQRRAAAGAVSPSHGHEHFVAETAAHFLYAVRDATGQGAPPPGRV